MNKNNTTTIRMLVIVFSLAFLISLFPNVDASSILSCNCGLDNLCSDPGKTCNGNLGTDSCNVPVGEDDPECCRINGVKTGLCEIIIGDQCDASWECCTEYGFFKEDGVSCGPVIETRYSCSDGEAYNYDVQMCGATLFKQDKFAQCNGVNEVCGNTPEWGSWQMVEDCSGGYCDAMVGSCTYCPSCVETGDSGPYDWYDQGGIYASECVQAGDFASCEILGEPEFDSCSSTGLSVHEKYCNSNNYFDVIIHNCDDNCIEGECLLCVDNDADGYNTLDSHAECPNYNSDCNDNNDYINSGAIELCNNIDDNCDGIIDDGLEDVCYCSGSSNPVPFGDLPVEICYDGIDNDCDMRIDNDDSDCACGLTSSCGEGEVCHLGECIPGIQVAKYFYDNDCGNANQINSWGKICKIIDEAARHYFEYDASGRITKEINAYTVDNILTNPGFEVESISSPFGWGLYTQANSEIKVVHENNKQGEGSVRIKQFVNTGNNDEWVALKHSIQDTDFKPGEKLTLSFWYKGTIDRTSYQYICYSIGWCSQYWFVNNSYKHPGQVQIWPDIQFAQILPGNYNDWTFYSSTITVPNSMLEGCFANNRLTSDCMEWLAIGNLRYEDYNVNVENELFIDSVQLERSRYPTDYTENTFVTRYDYDKVNNIQRIVNPGGVATSYQYNLLSQVISVGVDNLIRNPSFETGGHIPDYSVSDSYGTYIIDNIGKTGSHSLRMDGIGEYQINIPGSLIIPGKTYTYSLWAKTSVGFTGSTRVSHGRLNYVEGAAGGCDPLSWTGHGPDSNFDNWQRISEQFTVRSDCTPLRLELYVGYNGQDPETSGYRYIDNIKVEMSDAPSPFHVLDYTYNPVNTFNTISYDGGLVETVFDYYERDWVKSIKTGPGADGSYFYEYYTYDPEGNLETIEERNPDDSIVSSALLLYDAVDRLKETSGNYYTINEIYEYDKSGNRLLKNTNEYTYQPLTNRLQYDGVSYYGYDASGNIISKNEKNLIANPSFENVQFEGIPVGWEKKIIDNNLILNHEFYGEEEANLVPWEAYGDDVDWNSYNDSLTDGLSVRVNVSGSGGLKYYDPITIPVKPSTDYSVSARVKTGLITGGDQALSFRIQCHDLNHEGDNFLFEGLSSKNIATNSGWIIDQRMITTEGDADHCHLEFFLQNEVGEFFIDSVQFIEGQTQEDNFSLEEDLHKMSFEIDKAVSSDSQQSLLITSTDSFPREVDIGLQQIIGVDENSVYTFSLKSKLNNVNNAKVKLIELVDKQRTIYEHVLNIGSGSTSDFEFDMLTFNTYADTNGLEIDLILDPMESQTSNLWIDEVQLEKSNSYTSFSAGESHIYDTRGWLRGVDVDGDGIIDLEFLYDYRGLLVSRKTSNENVFYFYNQNGELIYETSGEYYITSSCDINNFDDSKNFVIKSGGQIVASIDRNGMWKIAGRIINYEPTLKSFSLKDQNNLLAAAVDSEGNLYVKGNIQLLAQDIEPSSQKEFIVQVGEGNEIALIDSLGNIKLKGCIVENAFS